MKQLVINTDGGARGNPGPAGCGAVIRDEAGKVLYEHKEYLGEQTNNFAEYTALIRALEAAVKLGASHLKINMDSELIVRQMQGSYKIKEPTLQKLAQQVIKLKNQFQSVEFAHVRRESNADADRLVNAAIDEATAGDSQTIDVYITSTVHHPWNVQFNPKLCAALEEQGLTCYLPQRNTNQNKRDEIFDANIRAISSAQTLLAVAANESPNWGAEVGFAHAKGKPVMILAEQEHAIPLIAQGMTQDLFIVSSLAEINQYIDKLAALIKKK